MKNLAAVVLAAGKGTRMKSEKPKVLHIVAGKPMLFFPVNLLKNSGAGKIVLVVGFGSEAVVEAFKDYGLSFVTQEEQLGTGHAVSCALKELRDFTGDVLVLSGDVPLIREETVKALLDLHRKGAKAKAAISLVTTVVENPKGYGRIVRDADGEIIRIVEEKDCSPLQRKIQEVNTGIYLFSASFLHANIKKLGKENAQGEYYLPDLVHLAVGEGLRVDSISTLDATEVMGVNNRVELAIAGEHMRARINEALMVSGVTIIDPRATYVDFGVAVGVDTVIYPGVRLTGATVIGAKCVIEEGSVITSSKVGDGSAIKSYSVIEDSEVGKENAIGPFARLRPKTILADKVRIGNFVEVKKSSLGKGSKANHLTYLGDSVIGEGVNIGAGTITCNYDGTNKSVTTIEDGAFIGSDSQLIAPVTVGKGAYVGSGTTVTKNVPAGSLVITRAPEKVIEGWAGRKFKGKGKEKE
ncbi:MAG: UDP-N-acetylglucosamine diphosphorylase/glucosamine-1-phosphate N-acetyltransferase [Deltaproteobacteria bacterium GWA2_54_12]|nr:MAG: UDP-N-acetylglucosamine diphosphorylase/glucosamine-1-phosphate N-acetyltransferase [Deltaproteobacteria bacterium GWA2_54_12]